MDYFTFIVLLILFIPCVRTTAKWSERRAIQQAQAEDARSMARRKEAEEREIEAEAIRLRKNWVNVSEEATPPPNELDETQPPNPIEEKFDAFDEWYFEDFSRIG